MTTSLKKAKTASNPDSTKPTSLRGGKKHKEHKMDLSKIWISDEQRQIINTEFEKHFKAQVEAKSEDLPEFLRGQLGLKSRYGQIVEDVKLKLIVDKMEENDLWEELDVLNKRLKSAASDRVHVDYYTLKDALMKLRCYSEFDGLCLYEKRTEAHWEAEEIMFRILQEDDWQYQLTRKVSLTMSGIFAYNKDGEVENIYPLHKGALDKQGHFTPSDSNDDE